MGILPLLIIDTEPNIPDIMDIEVIQHLDLFAIMMNIGSMMEVMAAMDDIDAIMMTIESALQKFEAFDG